MDTPEQPVFGRRAGEEAAAMHARQLKRPPRWTEVAVVLSVLVLVGCVAVPTMLKREKSSPEDDAPARSYTACLMYDQEAEGGAVTWTAWPDGTGVERADLLADERGALDAAGMAGRVARVQRKGAGRCSLVVRLNDTTLRDITGDAGTEDRDAAFSGDGRWLVFVRRSRAEMLCDLFLVRLPNGTPKRLTTDGWGHGVSAPAFSTDDELIAYVRDGDIYTVGVDGADPRRVIGTEDAEGDPAFLSGGRLFFSRTTRAKGGLTTNTLLTANRDGTDVKVLWRMTPPSPEIAYRRFVPNISNEYIAFERHQRTGARDVSDIYVMKDDGSKPQKIATGTHPCWGWRVIRGMP